MHLYHFNFNLILFVHTDQDNFHFNQHSIFIACWFWPSKRFEWSKPLLPRFSSSYKLQHFPSPPVRGNPLTPIWKTLFRGIQGHALSHGSSAIQQSMQHNFPFKFSSWYVDMSGHRLLPPLVASCSLHLLHQVPTPIGKQYSPHHYDGYGKPRLFFQ